MKISYAVTVSNEFDETIRLINHLKNYKGDNTEIVVLLDSTKAPKELEEFLVVCADGKDDFTLIISEFNGDFAAWKNFLNSHCKGEWIFQIDADEMIDAELVVNLEDILGDNDDVDLFFIPRINTVTGLTDYHIKRWGWNINERGWINYPDYQSRLYKRKDGIIWKNKVHERIFGYQKYSNFPAEPLFCIKHDKDIKRQELQNQLYERL
jgi:glycosyltransferase involved in cell wall biosynthesis